MKNYFIGVRRLSPLRIVIQTEKRSQKGKGEQMNYPTVTAQEVKDAIERKKGQFHAQVNAKAKAEGQPELQANWFACAACEAGLNTTLAAVILAAIAGFPEDTPAIAAIAAACGIPEAVVTSILAGGAGGLEAVISSLCKAMGACS